jgi:hypothetical protein
MKQTGLSLLMYSSKLSGKMSNAARMFTTDSRPALTSEGRPVFTTHSRVEFTTGRTGEALSE